MPYSLGIPIRYLLIFTIYEISRLEPERENATRRPGDYLAYVACLRNRYLGKVFFFFGMVIQLNCWKACCGGLQRC